MRTNEKVEEKVREGVEKIGVDEIELKNVAGPGDMYYHVRLTAATHFHFVWMNSMFYYKFIQHETKFIPIFSRFF